MREHALNKNEQLDYITKEIAMDKILLSLSDWIKSIIKDTLNKLIEIESENDNYPELMDISTTSNFLGIGETTFRNQYRYMQDFPKELPAKRWSKRAIKKWLSEQL
ncbi:DNA-binding protein [Streptococcus pyogenes]|uniref:DNA-binding protein n=4 Tax=Streptococcus TaxID=1301 RepID=A0A5S4TN38_STRPY|nr:hypothetical phage protein [Streptococcus pyogenes MGAS8232]AYZ10169.1 DNA-binding protein [Streptococcus pyogenes]QGH04816.1 DNA-binding protein [Streptococcus dysgalactiae subsp. dysgalactiae]BAC64257.1 hypothetical protein [Streptococcus pyogenes SSI-1]KAB1894640.1 DNA-binding protein [Streptococcus pyogenes]